MIPRIIHQIWLGNDAIRPDFQKNRQSWINLHPGWEVKLWTAEGLPNLLNQQSFDAADHFVLKADILRYELVYKYGGFYADMDVEALQPFDSLLDHRAVFAWEQPHVVGNACFGAVPGHPALERVIRLLPDNFRRMHDVLDRTGPFLLTRALESCFSADSITMLPEETFYPYRWNERHKASGPFGNSMAVHHWACSWR